ncbi:HIT domain-containing protein [Streptomyces sp. NPDC058301]|uniref:HIT domain-containing protein n=1 Tax=Streptomyces sp. NPDC058301 TaxID=3346436 RepID=UPI0036EEE825
MPRAAECSGSDLCDEIAGSRDTTFLRIYEGEPPSRLICATEHFRLLADLSPLTLGHLLLLPVAHYFSFAQLVTDFSAELDTILGKLEPMYRQTFGDFTLLEHGSSPGMEASACISHAHWHILPIAGRRIDALIVADGLDTTALTGMDQLAEFSGVPYFMCWHEAGLRVYRPRRPLRSQYLRSKVGALVGIADPLWDYALVVRKELFRETVALTSAWGADADRKPTRARPEAWRD